jgi:predicted dehydrogenase
MYQMRFVPACRRAIEIARGGQLGALIRATLIAPDYRSQAYYEAGRWRATWVGEGGGVLLNQSPHLTDLFLSLTGLPVWVQGFTAAAMHDIEVEDCAQAVLRFADGGFGYLYCSTIEPGPGPSMEIYGEKGKIIYRGGVVKHYRFQRPVREFTEDSTDMWAKLECREVPLGVEDRPTGHVDVMRNFARHILSGEELLCDGRSATAQVELANAIIYSGRTGQAVDLPLDRKAYDDLLAELREGSRYGTKIDQGKRITDPGFL